MNGKYFIDSSVLIYVFDETDSDKRTRSEDLIQSAVREGTGCISYQVVQETINVITGKLSATAIQAHQFLEDVLVPLWSVNPTNRLYRCGLDIMRRYRFSFYDSLIVAAALEARCKTLFSEDLQDGQIVEKLTIVNPFNLS
ncbi:MAG: PIN domain-containing protein [Acidiferrobacterales bacterium]|nr:PIN domain-containing protein [Acidiferrobacterales bacterium]